MIWFELQSEKWKLSVLLTFHLALMKLYCSKAELSNLSFGHPFLWIQRAKNIQNISSGFLVILDITVQLYEQSKLTSSKLPIKKKKFYFYSNNTASLSSLVIQKGREKWRGEVRSNYAEIHFINCSLPKPIIETTFLNYHEFQWVLVYLNS